MRGRKKHSTFYEVPTWEIPPLEDCGRLLTASTEATPKSNDEKVHISVDSLTLFLECHSSRLSFVSAIERDSIRVGGPNPSSGHDVTNNH